MLSESTAAFCAAAEIAMDDVVEMQQDDADSTAVMRRLGEQQRHDAASSMAVTYRGEQLHAEASSSKMMQSRSAICRV